jgi:EAL domain-containing protein (putative c-di-GMP-specific phosphodiesterase class I)
VYLPEPTDPRPSERRPIEALDRIPDVTLRVLFDGTCVEVFVSGSDAPPSPTFQIDEALLETALDELARSIGADRRQSSPNLPKRVTPRPLEELLPPEGASAVRRLVATAFRDRITTSGSYEVEADEDERRFAVRVIPNEGDAIVTIRDVTVDDPADAIEEALDRGDLSLRYRLRLDFGGAVQAVVARTFIADHEGLRPLENADRIAGLPARIDDWAVHEAVRHLAWASNAGVMVRIALAVSRDWLVRGDVAAILKGLLECYSAPAERLEICLDYDEWAVGPEDAVEAWNEIKRLGCTVALVGVGRHSIDLSELELMQVDRWVCDGAIVHDAGDKLADGALEAIAVLARACGAQPIAAGVAEARTTGYLRDLGYGGFEGAFAGDHHDARDAFRRARSRPSQ